MRVLDLGSGLGHVSRIVAELVGPHGEVVGIDRDPAMVAAAEARTEHAGTSNVCFQEADVTTWLAPLPFDAVVGRLILFHVVDPGAVVRHHVENLRAGGVLLALDYDLGTVRTEPQLEVVATAIDRVERTFTAVGASPRIGVRLGEILAAAGLVEVRSLGIQDYLPSDSPVGPALLTGVMTTLAPAMVAHGIATEEELALDTLSERVTRAMTQHDAVFLPPILVGASGRRAAAA